MLAIRRHVIFASEKMRQTMLVGCAMAWVIIYAGNVINLTMTTGAQRILEVRSVYFEMGKFHQIVVPKGGSAVQATWAAAIIKGNEYICGGGSISTYGYRVEPLILDPREWTGDDCGDLEIGETYSAQASWSWYDERGQRQSVSRAFEFTYTPEANS